MDTPSIPQHATPPVNRQVAAVLAYAEQLHELAACAAIDGIRIVPDIHGVPGRALRRIVDTRDLTVRDFPATDDRDYAFVVAELEVGDVGDGIVQLFSLDVSGFYSPIAAVAA